MKLSDYVAQNLIELGVKHVFMVTGGGAMHLNHSFGTRKEIECIFNHHEQACAIGAEAYYRLTNQLPVVNVTSGPGGTNAITGVYGAFVDSVVFVIVNVPLKFSFPPTYRVLAIPTPPAIVTDPAFVALESVKLLNPNTPPIMPFPPM